MNNNLNTIIEGDAIKILPKINENSIDAILTDPPYFLNKLDNQWNLKKVHDKKNLHTIKSLPAGMKFDKNQGKKFYDWYSKISKELYRVLKPGGFFFSFSSPRLYHRMVCAVEDAGFDIRDCFIWLYTMNQPKAMNLNHFIKKMPIPEQEKIALIHSFSNWKTPQIKSCFEPIVMAQKPVEGTFLKNMIKYKTSLMNTNVRQGINQDMFPSNVMSEQSISPIIDKVFLTNKPNKIEKGSNNSHKTVKPIAICKYLISLVTKDKATVLDPFIGSGTTAIACKTLHRNYIGIELNQEYIKIAQQRINNLQENKPCMQLNIG